mmetsp:Transcript_26798/g.50782  ORF Transcript_26798/g.50782 Transcript_26798/m.50782 type:complete len:277 (-) Transcript_26798:9-839(-)
MASYHSSTSARQQSLLRSLSVIHRPPSPTGIRHDVSPAHPICKKSQSKFQRRRATVTNADTTQPMMTKITSEKRRERRRTMGDRMNANNDSNGLNKSRRQPSVRFARVEEQHENGFRGDYTIGETLRSSSHMSIEATSEQAIQAIGSLDEHDFAFIKRSDGSYSYAILARRSMEPIKGADNNDTAKSMEECMTFVMSEAGATKMVRRRNWSNSVRLVRIPSSSSTQRRTSPVPCPEIENDEDCLVPSSSIEFVPQEFDDECSLISSVSDRIIGSRN